jgi:anti-sigma B factor antagonist
MITDRKVGDVLVVKPTRPRLDASEATNFRTHLGRAIDGGCAKIVLNLSQVEFIDSSGLGAIISGLKALGSYDRFLLCEIKESALTTFKLTRLDRVFPIFATEDEALASLSM